MNEIDPDEQISNHGRQMTVQNPSDFDDLEVNIFTQNFVKDKDEIAAATALQGEDDDEPEEPEAPLKPGEIIMTVVSKKSN